jgi:hypothetical protein
MNISHWLKFGRDSSLKSLHYAECGSINIIPSCDFVTF